MFGRSHDVKCEIWRTGPGSGGTIGALLLVLAVGTCGPSIRNLLIAATAELNRLAVLHVDKDFDLIAELTGQRVERLRTT
jgi:predicted nucleic acid-binding protein